MRHIYIYMVVLGSSESYMVVLGSSESYMVVLGSSESYIHGGVGVQ